MKYKFFYMITFLFVVMDNVFYSKVLSFVYTLPSYTLFQWIQFSCLLASGFTCLYFIRVINRILEEKLQKEKLKQLQLQTLENYLKQDFQQEDQTSFYLHDYEQYETYYLENIYSILRSGFEFIIAFSVLACVSLFMAFLTLVLGIVPFIIQILTKKITQYAYEKESQANSHSIDFLNMLIEGYNDIQVYHLQNQLDDLSQDTLDKLSKAKRKYQFLLKIIEISHESLSHFNYLVLVIIAMYLINQGKITFSSFILFSSMSESITYPIKSILISYSQIQSVQTIKSKIKKLLHIQPKQPQLTHFDHEIKVTNATIGYNNQPLLTSLNLTILKGQKILITGDNGSGKSTFCKTLGKQIPLLDGNITIDGNNINDYSIYSILKYVSTEDYLFHDSVINNLFTHHPNFLLPLSSDLNQDALTLSGGQKQIVSLVRCWNTSPSILILDEAFSALYDQTNNQLLDFILTNPNLTVIQVDHHLHEEYLHYYDQVIHLNKNTE